MTTETKLLTAEELFELPPIDGRRELIDGKVVEMAPPGQEHGFLTNWMAFTVTQFVHEHGLGWVSSGDPGVITRRSPDRVRGSDICFFAVGRLPEDRMPVGYSEVAPDLVVEIVSPTDRAADVRGKTEEWLQVGVRLVWTVYPSTRSIVASLPDGTEHVYREHDMLTGEPVLPGFQAPVASLFPQ